LEVVLKIRWKNSDFCRRIGLGEHFLAPSYRIFSNLSFQKTAANTLKALGNKIGVMHHSHLSFCVLDAVFFASEQFCAGTFWRLLTESNSKRACIRAAWV